MCNWNLTVNECHVISDTFSNNKSLLVNIYNPSATQLERVLTLQVPNLNFTLIDL
jgi:hypothetical protein